MLIPIEDFNCGIHDCKITIVSRKTGDHRTFQIKVADEGSLKGKRLAYLLVGPDKWRGFGWADRDGTRVIPWGRFVGTEYEKFADMVSNPKKYEAAAEYLIEGRCRVCGRPLTNPESIKTGIGPICAGRAR